VVWIAGILALVSLALHQPDALIDLRCIYRCDADNRLRVETRKDLADHAEIDSSTT